MEYHYLNTVNQIDEIFERTQTSDILSARRIVTATHFLLRIEILFQ